MFSLKLALSCKLLFLFHSFNMISFLEMSKQCLLQNKICKSAFHPCPLAAACPHICQPFRVCCAVACSMRVDDGQVFQVEDGSSAALPLAGLPRGGLGGHRAMLLRSPGSPCQGRPAPCMAQPPPTRRASEGTAVDGVFYPTLRRPMRGRSDSETLSDDAVMESQDEGFATDTRQSQGALQPVSVHAAARGLGEGAAGSDGSIGCVISFSPTLQNFVRLFVPENFRPTSFSL